MPLLKVHTAINDVNMLLTAMRGHKGHCISLAAIKLITFVITIMQILPGTSVTARLI